MNTSERTARLVSNPAPVICRNCGATLTGPYCSQCGQRDVNYHSSIANVFRDFLDAFLTFDGKVLQTLWLLMSRPGELTVRFLRGQQIRFLNPIRLYFSVSLLFFLVFHFTQPASKIVVLKGDLWPAIEQDTSPSSEGRAAEAFGQQFLAKMISKYGSVQTFGSHLASEFFERLQWMIFVCVPIYAVLLKVIYIRTSRTYLAHLVFAFHLHSAFFVGALIQALLAALLRTPHPGLTRWIFVLFSLWLVTCLFLAQRKVHGQRWVTIATKFFALYIAYAFILIGAVAATGLLAFYLTASV